MRPLQPQRSVRPGPTAGIPHQLLQTFQVIGKIKKNFSLEYISKNYAKFLPGGSKVKVHFHYWERSKSFLSIFAFVKLHPTSIQRFQWPLILLRSHGMPAGTARST